MAMEKFKHFSHECDLTLSEFDKDSICNICHKDGPVEYACKSCSFELCISCSKLPRKVYHDFHPEHPLEFSLFRYDRRPKYIICSGCGNMSLGSFYKCKTCEIYLDLGCALLKNIVEAWNIKEVLHDCHAHLIKRCRPGPDAKGSCLLCELPVSPSSISYGCVHCYSFVHHKCIDLPKEIQHPVHPAHPLRRLSYVRTCAGDITCDACTLKITGVPYSCIKCDIDLHLRCADSLLRGLMHKSHEHRLSYVATGARYFITKQTPCQICMRTKKTSLDSFYQCVECDLKFHFECLKIPKALIRKSFHTHPLVCKIFLGEDKSLEYCGVCETMVNAGHHTYCCEECDFLGHIDCILREEEPSPLYLKDLYLCGEDVTGATSREDHETKKTETKLLVDDVSHIHVMKPIDMSELNNPTNCNICRKEILGSPCKCTSCIFQAHHFCIELGLPSSTRLLHRNHPLTLLPNPPTQISTTCDLCKKHLSGFNLFCRICSFIIDINCALKSRHSLGILGKKVIGEWQRYCINGGHIMVQVMVSRSLSTSCTICFEKLYGKALSCMTCGDIYHFHCIEFWRKPVFDHPLHPDHTLGIRVRKGAECNACKRNISKYGYSCFICAADISFHIECITSVNLSGKIKSHIHYLYNFWVDDLPSNQVCNVCARPCGPSFYGCVDCKFKAHVECVGTAHIVKSHRHQHSVVNKHVCERERCSLCGLECSGHIYSCNHCSDVFHIRCLMPMHCHRKAATKEEQVCDIYLMYLERDLYDIYKSEFKFDSDPISEMRFKSFIFS